MEKIKKFGIENSYLNNMGKSIFIFQGSNNDDSTKEPKTHRTQKEQVFELHEDGK